MDYLLSQQSYYAAAIAAGTIFIPYYILQRTRIPRGTKALPEPAGKRPIIGHLHLLSGPEPPHITLSSLSDIHGPIFTIQSGIYKRVVVNRWEIAREIFTTHDALVLSRPPSCAAKYLGYNNADFGFTPAGPYWEAMRTIARLQLFSLERIDALRRLREDEVASSVVELYQRCLNPEDKSFAPFLKVEMKKWFGDLNLNVILMTVAGKRYDIGADDPEANRCINATRELFRLAGAPVLRDAIPFLGFLDVNKYERDMKSTAAVLDGLAEQWLQEHEVVHQAANGHIPNPDFMHILMTALKDGVGVDPQFHGRDVGTVCKTACLALVAGGTDTITITLIWTLALLLNHPEKMAMVQQELDAHVGNNRLVEESDVGKLKYLEAAVKESLRLYPAAPLSGSRIFSEDCVVSGYHVPRGTRLVLNVWKIHRDPRVWRDPLVFKPERFIRGHADFDKDSNLSGRRDFEILPFGGGRRGCPGMNFALPMTHLTLAVLLHSFEIRRTGDAEIDMTGSPGSTNFMANPLDVLIKPRLLPQAYVINTE